MFLGEKKWHAKLAGGKRMIHLKPFWPLLVKQYDRSYFYVIYMQKKTRLSENIIEKHKGMQDLRMVDETEGFLWGTAQETMTRYDNVVMTSLCHCVLPPFLTRCKELGFFFFKPPALNPRAGTSLKAINSLLHSLLPSLLPSVPSSLLSFLLPCPLHSLPSPGTSSSKSKSSWPSSSLLSDPGIFTA